MQLGDVIRFMAKSWEGYLKGVPSEGWQEPSPEQEDFLYGPSNVTDGVGMIKLLRITYVKKSTGTIVERLGELYKIKGTKHDILAYYIDHTKGGEDRSCSIRNIISLEITDISVFPRRI
jgi:hypothetical protein